VLTVTHSIFLASYINLWSIVYFSFCTDRQTNRQTHTVRLTDKRTLIRTITNRHSTAGTRLTSHCQTMFFGQAAGSIAERLECLRVPCSRSTSQRVEAWLFHCLRETCDMAQRGTPLHHNSAGFTSTAAAHRNELCFPSRCRCRCSLQTIQQTTECVVSRYERSFPLPRSRAPVCTAAACCMCHSWSIDNW